MPAQIDAAKQRAAQAALGLVRDNMFLALGAGSTLGAFLPLLAEKQQQEKLRLLCICAASSTLRAAQAQGLHLYREASTKEAGSVPHRRPDLMIDGADEITENGWAIKGGGGALLREKILAAASRKAVIIAHAEKCKPELGAFPLPVEISPFAHVWTVKAIEMVTSRLLGRPVYATLRSAPQDDRAFVTDNGNFIADVACGAPIADPRALHESLVALPGVVETGLFFDRFDCILLATPHSVRRIELCAASN